MKEEIEKLYNERKLLVKQIISVEEKVATIDDKIQDIRFKCPHKNINKHDCSIKDFKITLQTCEDCGEWLD